jgi:hypothetical protein
MYTIYEMLITRNSNKQIIYILKMTIFLMLLYFSSTYICESLFAITKSRNFMLYKELKYTHTYALKIIIICVINLKNMQNYTIYIN